MKWRGVEERRGEGERSEVEKREGERSEIRERRGKGKGEGKGKERERERQKEPGGGDWGKGEFYSPNQNQYITQATHVESVLSLTSH